MGLNCATLVKPSQPTVMVSRVMSVLEILGSAEKEGRLISSPIQIKLVILLALMTPILRSVSLLCQAPQRPTLRCARYGGVGCGGAFGFHFRVSGLFVLPVLPGPPF